MQWLAEWSFVIFEFSLFVVAPLVLLASLIADLVMVRRGVWRRGLLIAAVANALIVLGWLAAVGPNVLGLRPLVPSLVALEALVIAWMLALAVAPLANAVFFVAFAVWQRRRRRMIALSVPPAIPSTGS